MAVRYCMSLMQLWEFQRKLKCGDIWCPFCVFKSYNPCAMYLVPVRYPENSAMASPRWEMWEKRRHLCSVSRYQMWTSHLGLEVAVLSSKHSDRKSSWPGHCRVTWCSGLEEGFVLPRATSSSPRLVSCVGLSSQGERGRGIWSPAEFVCPLGPSLCLCQQVRITPLRSQAFLPASAPLPQPRVALLDPTPRQSPISAGIEQALCSRGQPSLAPCHSQTSYSFFLFLKIDLKYSWFTMLCLISAVQQTVSVQFRSVAQSCLTLCDPMNRQHTRPPCPSPTPRVHPNSCPLSQWCHPVISSSVVRFSSCPQSFPASGSFQMSQLFASGGQSIGVPASTSVLPMNIQDWFPSGLTGWISLQSKGLSRVFSNTTVPKHQFFGGQLSLLSNSHIHTWIWEKPYPWLDRPLLTK